MISVHRGLRMHGRGTKSSLPYTIASYYPGPYADMRKGFLHNSGPSVQSRLLDFGGRGPKGRISRQKVSRLESKGGSWGGAPAEIEFGALFKKMTSGGNNLKKFPGNQLTKFRAV